MKIAKKQKQGPVLSYIHLAPFAGLGLLGIGIYALLRAFRRSSSGSYYQAPSETTLNLGAERYVNIERFKECIKKNWPEYADIDVQNIPLAIGNLIIEKCGPETLK